VADRLPKHMQVPGFNPKEKKVKKDEYCQGLAEVEGSPLFFFSKHFC
jgi:hypothetical protein